MTDHQHAFGTNRPLRGAVLGTGSIAIHHLRAWREIASAEIVALANRTRSRAVALGREFGIDEEHIYADYREVLARENLDFVDIATAPHVHCEQVLAAAAGGVHVLCQKPFAESLDEARRMISACATSGVRCIVNENWRWRSWYREIKRLIVTRTIGAPRYARFFWHGDEALPQPDGSRPALLARQPYTAEMPRLILFEWGIHLVDVLRFLLGDIRRVSAWVHRTSPLVQGEDRAVIHLEFACAAAGLIDISWGTPIPAERRLPRGSTDALLIEGTAGSIELDPYRDDALTITGSDRRQEQRPARAGRTRAEAYQASYRTAQEHFVESLRRGVPAENEAADNLKTLAAVFSAYESAERKQAVDVSSDL